MGNERERNKYTHLNGNIYKKPPKWKILSCFEICCCFCYYEIWIVLLLFVSMMRTYETKTKNKLLNWQEMHLHCMEPDRYWPIKTTVWQMKLIENGTHDEMKYFEIFLLDHMETLTLNIFQWLIHWPRYTQKWMKKPTCKICFV